MTPTDEIIRGFFDALNAGDGSTAVSFMADDVVHDTGDGEREFGRDAYRRYLGKRARRGRESYGDLVIMINGDGTRAAAEFTLRGRKSDGERISVNAGMFFAVSGGEITRVTPCGMPEAAE